MLVLETIPGLRFRRRAAEFSLAAAVDHHRALVEAHASHTLDHSHVKEILGLEPGYTPMLEHSLRIIPEIQLPPIDWTRPIGRGANGSVYASTWTRPGGVLSTSEAGPIEVVLKDVGPQLGGGTGTGTTPTAKFMKEVG